ncbi:hypothetical protein [Sphaerisporangium dianthi]|uniref:Uncharacterized protein n=1 Tax=Sphaerisporangium dianthi TaxID=1436120 RepID=A0ABV9CPN7_9ACTN
MADVEPADAPYVESTVILPWNTLMLTISLLDVPTMNSVLPLTRTDVPAAACAGTLTGDHRWCAVGTGRVRASRRVACP